MASPISSKIVNYPHLAYSGKDNVIAGRIVELENWQLFAILMTLHCINGTIAAIIARQKGRRFSAWLIGGLIGGTLVLVAAFMVQPLSEKSNKPLT